MHNGQSFFSSSQTGTTTSLSSNPNVNFAEPVAPNTTSTGSISTSQVGTTAPASTTTQTSSVSNANIGKVQSKESGVQLKKEDVLKQIYKPLFKELKKTVNPIFANGDYFFITTGSIGSKFTSRQILILERRETDEITPQEYFRPRWLAKLDKDTHQFVVQDLERQNKQDKRERYFNLRKNANHWDYKRNELNRNTLRNFLSKNNTITLFLETEEIKHGKTIKTLQGITKAAVDSLIADIAAPRTPNDRFENHRELVGFSLKEVYFKINKAGNHLTLLSSTPETWQEKIIPEFFSEPASTLASTQPVTPGVSSTPGTAPLTVPYVGQYPLPSPVPTGTPGHGSAPGTTSYPVHMPVTGTPESEASPGYEGAEDEFGEFSDEDEEELRSNRNRTSSSSLKKLSDDFLSALDSVTDFLATLRNNEYLDLENTGINIERLKGNLEKLTNDFKRFQEITNKAIDQNNTDVKKEIEILKNQINELLNIKNNLETLLEQQKRGSQKQDEIIKGLTEKINDLNEKLNALVLKFDTELLELNKLREDIEKYKKTEEVSNSKFDFISKEVEALKNQMKGLLNIKNDLEAKLEQQNQDAQKQQTEIKNKLTAEIRNLREGFAVEKSKILKDQKDNVQKTKDLETKFELQNQNLAEVIKTLQDENKKLHGQNVALNLNLEQTNFIAKTAMQEVDALKNQHDVGADKHTQETTTSAQGTFFDNGKRKSARISQQQHKASKQQPEVQVQSATKKHRFT